MPSSCVPGSGCGGGAIVCEIKVPVVPPTARPTDVHSIMPRYLRKMDGEAVGFWLEVDAFLLWRTIRRLLVELFRKLFIVCMCVCVP